MTTPSSSAFKQLCTPGQNMFCIWAAAYAPPIGHAPAQIFFGEWTGSQKGADLIVMDPDTGRQEIIGFDGFSSTQCLYVDPYRPIVWLSSEKQLFEIDRVTLKPRVACEMPRHFSADVDRQGRLWFAKERSLSCYDPATGQVTVYPDITPDEYYYKEGTHMSLGVGPDGRIWTNQFPIGCLAVFDPATRTTKVVWGQPGTSHDPRRAQPGAKAERRSGEPVAIGGLIFAGTLCVDARTLELVEPPFPVTGDEGYRFLMRGGWNRTPTALLDREGSVLAAHKRQVGWLEVKSGRFTEIGTVPDEMSADFGGSLHDGHILTTCVPQAAIAMNVDLKTKKIAHYPLQGPYKHAQNMFEWTVGPDDNFYGSCYSHEMWQVSRDGSFKNHGDVVRIHGGELHAFTNWKNKMFICSYTHSVLTRVDVTRPTDNWGKEAANNPRHLVNLLLEHDGQHRPSAVAATPGGHIYYLSRADYCTRREGVLVIVDAETEQVLKIVDPLIPGEQLWGLAISPTRDEAYIGTNRGTFVIWDTKAMKIKRTIKFDPRPGDGQPTSAMSETGTIKHLGAVGDLVVGNMFGGDYDFFTYHADTGVMDLPKPYPLGKVFGIFPWKKRGTLLLYILGQLHEMDKTGAVRLLYPAPLPGYATKEGPDGRLYISDGMTIFGEVEPAYQRLAAADKKG